MEAVKKNNWCALKKKQPQANNKNPSKPHRLLKLGALEEL